MATIMGKPVGRTGYGLMNLTWRTTPISDEQAFAAMRAALNSGSNFWNAGELYGKPHANSLHLLNRYFTKYPEDADKVVISVKGGLVPGEMRPDGSEKNTRRSIDECLKVLDGKKFLDIYEPARQDPKTPMKETLDIMALYVKEGKLGGLGISEVTAGQITEAASLHPIAAVEVEMSLQSPDILTNGVASTCAELNIPIVAYSPLGRGLLTATIAKPEDIDPSDNRHGLLRFAPGNIEKNALMGKEVQKLAKAKGCTAAQVALAWVRSYSEKPGFGTIIPIPGSTTEERTIENSNEVLLTQSELQELEDIRNNIEVAGARNARNTTH